MNGPLDIYIINTRTLNIYYLRGVEYRDDIFHVVER